MSGPSMDEQVWTRDAESIKRRHIQNLRRLADNAEDDGYFRTETREGYPEFDDATREAVAALLRAKADKIEAHMEAIDNNLSREFSSLVKAVEWCSTGDYGSGKVAEAWDEYDEVR